MCLTCALRVPRHYPSAHAACTRTHTYFPECVWKPGACTQECVCVCVLVCLLVCVCTARHESRRDTGAESQYPNQLTILKPLTLLSVRVLIVEPMNVYPLFKNLEPRLRTECLSAIKNLEPRLRTHTKTLVACACKLRRATKAFKSGFVFLES